MRHNWFCLEQGSDRFLDEMLSCLGEPDDRRSRLDPQLSRSTHSQREVDMPIATGVSVAAAMAEGRPIRREPARPSTRFGDTGRHRTEQLSPVGHALIIETLDEPGRGGPDSKQGRWSRGARRPRTLVRVMPTGVAAQRRDHLGTQNRQSRTVRSAQEA
jgi:hypothetical protein